MLGDPPLSRDKSTIGDEVNWEMLLANLEDDLIIVTKDSTYFDSQYLLKEEFKTKKHKELKLITKRLSEALQMMEIKVTNEMKEAEDNRINEEKIEKERALELLAIDMVSASTLSTVAAAVVSNELSYLDLRSVLDNARKEALISLLSESGSVKSCKKCGERIPDGQDKCPTCKI
jgi:hypothetical protein